ncbi:diacylglycerol kinase family lipid kinase [Empedobacter falsenii]|uniref:diacylglycerol/lipid kinase family protein n=1 Tax=Empedobacter falsenii TaxID=343874 RepID=UPI00257572FE|nr:diacylglycerol kinase family protein [Empedobacter falsenii]MDM1299043.1 diacylglycerol kinase family lipid kinase [Empedobacter falsenii]MDM1318836.1 diacylglycerol kinase family lipid kinase [Empedobacter falsenii]
MKNKIIFIINPIAGKGKGRMIETEIQSYFNQKNVEFETFLTESIGHATEITNQVLTKNPDIIVACGGDGTINEVAQALVGSNVALGIIPIGSGNGLAANLHIPKTTEKAFETILNAKINKIDAGKINENYFFSNMGLGIDADVINNYAQTKTRNFLGYVTASTKAIFSFQPKKFSIELDNEHTLDDDFYFVFCSNSNEAGYGISFSPNAKLNDGKLDFLAVKKLNFIQQIQFSANVLGKRIEKMKQAKVLQVNSIKFNSNQPKSIAQVDGEAVIFNQNSIEVSIVPNALNVIVPY